MKKLFVLILVIGFSLIIVLMLFLGVFSYRELMTVAVAQDHFLEEEEVSSLVSQMRSNVDVAFGTHSEYIEAYVDFSAATILDNSNEVEARNQMMDSFAEADASVESLMSSYKSSCNQVNSMIDDSDEMHMISDGDLQLIDECGQDLYHGALL